MIVHVLIQNMALHVCMYSNSFYRRMYVEGSRVFLNQVHTWFLKIIICKVAMHLCVSAPEAIST